MGSERRLPGSWLARAMRLEFVRRLVGKNVRKKNPIET
jgi:hypothetical protein